MHQILEIDYLFLMLITREVALTLVTLQLKGKLPTSLKAELESEAVSNHRVS